MKSTFKVFGSLWIFWFSTGVLANLELPGGQDELSSEKPNDGQSNIASVSKFITNFYKQIADEMEENASVVASDVPVVNQSRAVGTADSSNSTHLVTCNLERVAGNPNVELVNSSRLMELLNTNPNITTRNKKADCVMVMFYARTCPFSCKAAPHYNALPRAFPAIKMGAVNAFEQQSFNTQYGIVGVPTIMLFHNGRPAARFNDSEYTLEMFSRFITRHTGIAPEKMFVTSADFGGPVGSVLVKETDYWLGVAWLVIAVVGGVGVAKSRMWRSLVEAVQNSWREAEAQHFHTD